jgi:hypothetical protein
MSFDYAALRTVWYREGWFSSRTCIDAFEAGACDRGSTSVDFVSAASVLSVTVADVHDAAVTFAAEPPWFCIEHCVLIVDLDIDYLVTYVGTEAARPAGQR